MYKRLLVKWIQLLEKKEEVFVVEQEKQHIVSLLPVESNAALRLSKEHWKEHLAGRKTSSLIIFLLNHVSISSLRRHTSQNTVHDLDGDVDYHDMKPGWTVARSLEQQKSVNFV